MMNKIKPKGMVEDKDGKPIDVWCNFDELVEPEKLIPNPRNPNTHTEEQINRLAIIIRFQGWRNKIVVSNQSGFIVKGHARLQAAMLLGCKAPIEYQESFIHMRERYLNLQCRLAYTLTYQS